tara:strand:- start:56 stop:2251 length:2196 start_codon:yes stop_codon:yes gene_type:complete
MSTEFFNDQWRIPSNENQNKVSNYSCEFDGTNEIELRNSSSTNTSLNSTPDASISAWIYKTNVNGYGAVYSNSRGNSGYFGFQLLVTNLNKLQLRCNLSNNIKTSTATVPHNEWVHVAATYKSGSSSEIKLSINGVIETFTPGFSTPLNYTNPAVSSGVVIGDGLGIFAFVGKIDQVSVFDYALPATGTNSIATIYGGGTAVTNPMALSPKPIAAYQLGDQSVDNGANYLVPNNSLQDYVFSFDGTDDYIDLSVSSSSSVPSEQSSWTYSAWLYLDSTHTASFPTVFQRGQGYPGAGMLVRETAGNIQVFVGTSLTHFSLNKLPTNVWSHFALVYDLSTNQLTCCINNSFQTLTMTAGWSILTTGFNIGYRNNNTSYWKGEMSNVQVFNTALPETGSNSIETIYNNGSPLTSMSGFTSLQSWYKLNAQDTFDGTDWTIKDSAGSNDGTSSGMTSANLVQSDLQQTSGYSPYAITLDGTGQVFNLDSEILLPDNKSVSFWFKLRVVPAGQFAIPLSSSNNRYYPLLDNLNGNFRIFLQGANGAIITNTSVPIESGVWYNFIITGDGTTPIVYINGAAVSNFGSGVDRTDVLIGDIGARPNGTFDLDGDMSNVAVWSGTTLSSTEVTEVYNQGVPSNLNTFSGTKPTAWWQLGSNSSFNSATSQWTCLDEIGTNNAASSTNMANDDITNGVGYSANGLGTSSIDIVGDAPYSSGNGLSENMDVLDRVKDTPPT